MFTVTPTAAEQFKAVLSETNKEGFYIRLLVNGVG